MCKNDLRTGVEFSAQAIERIRYIESERDNVLKGLDIEKMTAYRMSERVTELVAQVAMLRETLRDVENMYPDCPPVLAALATPLPFADAMAEVVRTAIRLEAEMRGIAVTTKTRGDFHLAVNAYHALRDGGDADGGV